MPNTYEQELVEEIGQSRDPRHPIAAFLVRVTHLVSTSCPEGSLHMQRSLIERSVLLTRGNQT